MNKRIERLTLKGFRGASQAVEVTFDASPITLIFGENGSGKSTLCDAIDFVCNGRFGSLQDKSASLRASESVVSIGAKPADLQVELEFAGQIWRARLKGTKADISGPVERPAAYVLRRADITRVVEATPKDKYEALKQFITAPAIEKIEKSLRDAMSKLKSQLEEAARAKQQADDTLTLLWQNAGSPGDNATVWAESLAATRDADFRARLSETQSKLDAIGAMERALERQRTTSDALVTLHPQVDAAQTQLNALSAAAQGQNAALLRVLREVRDFLGSTSPDVCPVCGLPNDAAHLREHVERQLDSMTALAAAQQALDDLQRRLRTADDAVRTSTAELLKSTQTNSVDAAIAAVGSASGGRAALSAQADADRKSQAQVEGVRTHLKTIESRTQPLIDGFQTQVTLEKMLAVVEARRKAYVDRMLSEISSTVDALYARIHPAEELGNVRFYLKANTIGSLEFDGKFQTVDGVPPASYYSEAHLDTLGLCVYLALARHLKQNAIIVLDDVLTSIDDAHLSRVIDLLHDEAPSFNQIIITTHFRAWRDKYRYLQAPGQQVNLIQLNRWSLERGVRHSKDQHALDELRAEIESEPIDRQALASKAGILMESLLLQLGHLYRIRLPLKSDGDYTLVELSRGFDAKLKRVLRVKRGGDGVALEDMLAQIDASAFIRNQVGAHYSSAASKIPDQDVLDFAALAVRFAESLVCPRCGQTPTRNKSGVDFECQCGHTHLEPLMAPQ
jgi:energy-coupling factor transporter ATP-binding protein EcfA2